MDDDARISTGVLVAGVLWITVAMFVVASWLVWAFGGSDDVAALLGLTAAAFVGPATVAHARLYVVRVCFIIRATAEQRRPDDGGLHSVSG